MIRRTPRSTPFPYTTLFRSRVEASATISLGSALGYLGDTEAGVAKQREGLRIAREAGDHEMTLRAMLNLSDLLASLGDHAGCAHTAEEAIAYARDAGGLASWWPLLAYNVADARLAVGEWDAAERALSDAVARSEERRV